MAPINAAADPQTTVPRRRLPDCLCLSMNPIRRRASRQEFRKNLSQQFRDS
jgi:hypothetical protein